ncbi:hypothetical protein SNE40_018057 [Patella caerulea]|uniref:Uncharacterized protein n=1 Tax=Patella caerulea TaxID=87958 RepID=A0AAN8JAL2_PATCE
MNSVSLICVALVTVCLVVDVTRGQGTNCKVTGCGPNSRRINVRRPGQPARYIDVCCRPEDGIQSSIYLRAGSANATNNAFCECDFTRIKGNCERGEQCTGIKAILSPFSFNGMKICCETFTGRVSRFNQTGNTRDYICQCSEPPVPNADDWTGNCWKGSQCNGCDAGYVGNVNGLKLCCANCVKKGLNINAGRKTCNCNV